MAKKIPKRSKPSPMPGAAMPGETASPAKEHPHANKAVQEAPQHSKPQKEKQLFPIVGVGASAGGLEAFTVFLKHLPSDSGMAFVLIQHLDPKYNSNLTELLSKATTMPIREVDATTPVKPNHVYVMAPGVCLCMSDGHLRADERGKGRNLPIDYFLRSLASDNTSKAIGIVLSGTASDGTLGLKAVKAEGGIAFAQEPSSAKFDGMPRSAIAAGVVDFVLPPEEIAKRLVRIAQHSSLDLKSGEDGEAAQEVESALNRIFHILRTVTGNDFTHYKHTTLRRRIHRRMVLHADEKLSGYVAYLQENPAEVRALADDLLICVTSFFREPEYFEALANRIFPEILKNRSAKDSIRIWVPGCATGEEAYSIAICLAEFLEKSGANVPVQIFGTDISESAIDKARVGNYATPALAGVSPARLKRFFEKSSGGYQIAKSIREGCIFAKQNATKDPPFHKLDLISCCNLLIYLGPVLQKKVLATFHYALNPNGFLMLGRSESVGPLSRAFSPLDKKLKLYSRQPWSHPLDFESGVSQGMGELLTTRTQGNETAAGVSRTLLDVQKTAERMLLAQYAPAGVIVDDAMNVVHVRGDIGPYLQIAPGEPTYNLLKMAREGMVVGPRTAILKASRKKAAITQPARVKQHGQFREISLKVLPINGSAALHFLILFEHEPAPAVPPPPERAGKQKIKTPVARNGRETSRLNQELIATREYLQSIIEEQEASTEELKSANEEAQASNEELETSKEELQSANEELNTLNDELKVRNGALVEVNTDLSNVLAGINVPLVIVGKDLRIRRFTPSIEPMLNLIESDIGRSISDLRPNIDMHDLPELLRNASNEGNPGRREIQGPKGGWYTLQALPYRGADNKIDGALLVLLDIDSVKRSHDFAKAIVETMRYPLVILTKDLKVRSANQAFFETFKVAKEETENRFIYDLGNGQWNIPKLREALEKILPEKGEFDHFEAEHQFENIGRKSMLLSAREIRQGTPFGAPAILLAIEDITERKRMEDVRHENEERYRILFDLGPAAIYSCDASGTIQNFNRRAVELWGREPKAGDTDEVFCGSYKMYRADGTFMPHELCPMADVLSGKIPEAHDMEVQIERPDGSRIVAMVNIRVLKNEREEITGAINSFVDVTMLKEAEDSLLESRAGLQKANEDLTHFAYAASHDLQEPLRMITAYSQLLAREYKGKLDQKADQCIAYTVEGAQRMDALLKGMREYWQVAERGEERRISVDCDEVLEKVLSNLNETVKESGAMIRHDPLPVVWAEEMPLVELFQNLIANAIKYHGSAAPEIHVSAAKNDHGGWAFSVRDNGIGIDPRHAEKIFAVFNRLNGGKYPGSGIGLAICRKIVKRLGGRIWVESELGRGSDFKFTIPPRE